MNYKVFDVPMKEFLLRCGWIAVRLLLALILMKRGAYFFYQGF